MGISIKRTSTWDRLHQISSMLENMFNSHDWLSKRETANHPILQPSIPTKQFRFSPHSGSKCSFHLLLDLPSHSSSLWSKFLATPSSSLHSQLFHRLIPSFASCTICWVCYYRSKAPVLGLIRPPKVVPTKVLIH